MHLEIETKGAQIFFRIILIALFIVTYFPDLAMSSNSCTVWAWGSNLRDQLGDSTEIDRLTPVRVKNLSGVTEAAIGNGYSIALKVDGTVWGWERIDMGH